MDILNSQLPQYNLAERMDAFIHDTDTGNSVSNRANAGSERDLQKLESGSMGGGKLGFTRSNFLDSDCGILDANLSVDGHFLS